MSAACVQGSVTEPTCVTIPTVPPTTTTVSVPPPHHTPPTLAFTGADFITLWAVGFSLALAGLAMQIRRWRRG